jgi:hypothetical protein
VGLQERHLPQRSYFTFSLTLLFLFQIEQPSFRPEQLAFFASCGVEKSASLPQSLVRRNAFAFALQLFLEKRTTAVRPAKGLLRARIQTLQRSFISPKAFLQPSGNLRKTSSN